MAQEWMSLTWSFEPALEPRQAVLLPALKPHVARWATKILPKLRNNLRHDSAAEASMATDLLEAEAGGIRLWVFVAMIANRDIGDDAVAMVARSEEAALRFAAAFGEATNTRMGPPTKVF